MESSVDFDGMSFVGKFAYLDIFPQRVGVERYMDNRTGQHWELDRKRREYRELFEEADPGPWTKLNP